MQLDIFLIAASASLREALQRIENNHHGMIFITDANGAVCKNFEWMLSKSPDGQCLIHLNGAEVPLQISY